MLVEECWNSLESFYTWALRTNELFWKHHWQWLVAVRVCRDVSWFQIWLSVLLLNKLTASYIFISAHGPCLSVCCEEANTRGFFNELAELRCVKTRRISDRTSVLKQKWGKPRQSKFHSRFPFTPSCGLDKNFHHQQRVSHKFLFVVLRLFIDISNCSKTFSIRLSYISSLTKCPMLKLLKHIQSQVFRSRISYRGGSRIFLQIQPKLWVACTCFCYQYSDLKCHLRNIFQFVSIISNEACVIDFR